MTGEEPFNGLTFDDSGNLYGATVIGGLSNLGTVFELTNTAGFGWTENVIYDFTYGSDASQPYAGLIFDQSGNLYGATSLGGARVAVGSPSD